MQPSCALTDFIFTVELVQAPNKSILQTWTGPLSEETEDGFTVPINWREWDHKWEGLGQSRIHLEVIISRVVQGQLLSKRIFESDGSPDDIEEEICFYGRALLQERGSLWEIDGISAVPELGIRMKPGSYEELELRFVRYIPDVQSDPMSRNQLLCYLEHDLCW